MVAVFNFSWISSSAYRAGVLNLWVMTPLGVKQLFHRGHLRPFENTDVNITIRDSSKIIDMKWQ